MKILEDVCKGFDCSNDGYKPCKVDAETNRKINEKQEELNKKLVSMRNDPKVDKSAYIKAEQEVSQEFSDFCKKLRGGEK